MNYIAFDPGETTGIAQYQAGINNLYTTVCDPTRLVEWIEESKLHKDIWTVLIESPTFGKTLKIASYYQGYITARLNVRYPWLEVITVSAVSKRMYEPLAGKIIRCNKSSYMASHNIDALAHILAYTKKFYKEDYEKLITLTN